MSSVTPPTPEHFLCRISVAYLSVLNSLFLCLGFFFPLYFSLHISLVLCIVILASCSYTLLQHERFQDTPMSTSRSDRSKSCCFPNNKNTARFVRRLQKFNCVVLSTRKNKQNKSSDCHLIMTCPLLM